MRRQVLRTQKGPIFRSKLSVLRLLFLRHLLQAGQWVVYGAQTPTEILRWRDYVRKYRWLKAACLLEKHVAVGRKWQAMEFSLASCASDRALDLRSGDLRVIGSRIPALPTIPCSNFRVQRFREACASITWRREMLQKRKASI